MRLSEIVKNYRNTNSLSQEEFGKRCGLTKAYISMIENEKNSKNKKKITPRIDSLAKIARGMGMELDELVRSIDKDMVVSLMPTTPVLTEEELCLIAEFRKLNEDGKPVLNYDRLRSHYWERCGLLADHLPHDGRHTCATLLDNAGVAKRTIQLILGHSAKDITERVYTHKTIDQLIEAINKI